VKPVFPSQSGYDGVAEIREARQNRIESMRLHVGADGVGMSDVEVQGCHSRETEVFDQPLAGVEADVTETDLIAPAFRQEAGNQGSDLSSTQDEHAMHGRPHLVQYTPALAGCGKTILLRENFEGPHVLDYEREKRDGRDGGGFEVFGTTNPELRTSDRARRQLAKVFPTI
jgi:hypothetical protein